MAKVSILIPSRNETYEVAPGVTVLQRMVDDIFEKCSGDFEVLVSQDGPPFQDLGERPGLRVFNQPTAIGLKPGVNMLAQAAAGKYLLKFDSHCMLSPGIDETLQLEMQPEWMLVPRFYTLDAENWRWQDERFCDYWLLDCPLTDPRGYRFRAGGYWWERTKSNLGIGPLDESLTHHGSGWFVDRQFFLDKIGGMSSAGYGHFGMEPAELGLKYWLGPWEGRVLVRKDCWYAHMHKGGQRPRGWPLSRQEIQASYDYAANYWMLNLWKERKHDIEWVIDRFSPIPTWPVNWREREAAYRRGLANALPADAGLHPGQVQPDAGAAPGAD